MRDAGAYRLPGFPYLRADRFLASFRDTASRDQQAFNAWVGHLRALDAGARDYELKNLPQQAFPVLDASDREAARSETRACAARLASEDLESAERRSLLLANAKVPDDYVDWKRHFGLYPITRILFMKGVEASEAETMAAFKQARMNGAAESRFESYHFSTSPPSADRIAAIFSQLKTDALGIPRLDAKDRDTLFQAYAPRFEVETTGRFDRFGPLIRNGNSTPEVDVSRPLVYARLAFTRYHGQSLLQLVYTTWFPERPADGAFDTLAGKLDGVVLRVTLDTDGTPLVYDSIHPCGCYHMFFPTARMKPLPAPESGIEWAFVPVTLPAMDRGQRIVVRIASRTHYVVDVHADAGESAAIPYLLAEDDELRAIADAGGITRSAFGPDGIVAGTERSERLLYWSMGIDNPGAMRQWGRHATAFVGRRHFDDADLIELRFEMSDRSRARPAR